MISSFAGYPFRFTYEIKPVTALITSQVEQAGRIYERDLSVY